jgi:N6-L-threonylcarbamoyladenine synthase
MLVLGIETSCDETSAALVDQDYRAHANVILSQQDHAPFGGVVPELASRAHVRGLLPVIRQAFEEADMEWGDIDGIAVTRGPGLVGSLIVGLSVAKGLAWAQKKPLIGVHHLEGHIFSNLIDRQLELPFLTLLVSGGHTELIEVRSLGEYRLLGKTRDDAAGEAFDKVAKLLGLLPPEGVIMGGRAVSEKAATGDPKAVSFPRALRGEDSFDFSFSGLKTAVLNYVRQVPDDELSDRKADIAASFEAAVVDVLIERAVRAMDKTGIKCVTLAGGVAANRRLRQDMRAAVEGAGGHLVYPELSLCTDNAAMIAAAGAFRLGRGETSDFSVDAVARIGL